MNYKQIAALYKISRVTLWMHLKENRKELERLADRYLFKGRWYKKVRLNRNQITLIVKVMGDTPEGYRLVKGQLLKIDEDNFNKS